MGQAAPPYQVDIAELIEPEAVLGGGDSREVVGLETLVAEPHSFGHPAASVTEITVSIQIASSKYFVIPVWLMFCSVLFLTPFQPQFTFTSRDARCLYQATHGIPEQLCHCTVFAGSVLTASSFLQEYRYDMTLMTSSSAEIHFTDSLRAYKYAPKKHKLFHHTEICLIS